MPYTGIITQMKIYAKIKTISMKFCFNYSANVPHEL